MPPAFVSNGLTTKAAYVAELAQDKGQFLPNGMMPASGPPTVLAIEKFTGNVTGPVNLAGTYTNKYAIAANKLEGFPANPPALAAQGRPSPEQRDVRESW